MTETGIDDDSSSIRQLIWVNDVHDNRVEVQEKKTIEGMKTNNGEEHAPNDKRN